MYNKIYNKTNNFLKENIQYCSFCGKECHNLNSLKQHEIRCQKNPNKINIFKNHLGNKGNNKGKTSWNAGLSKETDERLANLSKKFIGRHFSPTNGKAATNEAEQLRKLRISHSMKMNGKAGGLRDGSGRGKKGYYKGYYCASTYELVWIIYNLDHNIQFKRCNRVYNYFYKNKMHKYYPDFELSDGSLIEIKGYYSEVVSFKTAAVTDRKITVLYEKDLEEMFKYVKTAYSFTNITDLYD